MPKTFNIRKAVKFGIVAVGVSVVCSVAVIGTIVGTLGVLTCQKTNKTKEKEND